MPIEKKQLEEIRKKVSHITDPKAKRKEYRRLYDKFLYNNNKEKNGKGRILTEEQKNRYEKIRLEKNKRIEELVEKGKIAEEKEKYDRDNERGLLKFDEWIRENQNLYIRKITYVNKKGYEITVNMKK